MNRAFRVRIDKTLQSLSDGFASLATGLGRQHALGNWIAIFGWVLAAGVIFGAAVVRLRLDPVAISDQDTWGYLNPALCWLSGHGFQQSSGRDWLYPAMVGLGLTLTGSVKGLVVLQQVLGILSGLLFWAVLRLWRSLLSSGLAADLAVALLGPLGAAIYLFNPATIVFELQIRPEAVLGFFGLAQLACLTAFIRARWKTRDARGIVIFGILAFVLAYACVLLKPSWAFAAVGTVLPVFAGVFGKGVSAFVKWTTPMAAVAIAFLVLWLPAKAMFIKDTASRTFLPQVLFTVHAQWILAQMEKETGRLPAQSPEGAFLRDLLPVFRAELSKAREGVDCYKHLGYNADYLMYQSPIMSWMMSHRASTDIEMIPFYYHWYFRTLLADPGGIAGKVWGQMTYFVFPDASTISLKQISMGRQYATSLTSLPKYPNNPSPRIAAIYAGYLDALNNAERRSWVLRSIPSLQALSHWGVAWFLPLEILFAIFFTLSILYRQMADFRLAGAAAAVIFSAAFGNALTVSIIHALDIPRYRYSYGGFLLLAVIVLAVYCLAFAASGIGRWMEIRRHSQNPQCEGIEATPLESV